MTIKMVPEILVKIVSEGCWKVHQRAIVKRFGRVLAHLGISRYRDARSLGALDSCNTGSDGSILPQCNAYMYM